MKNKSGITRFCTLFLLVFIAAGVAAQTEQTRSLPQFLFEKFNKGIIKLKDGKTYVANMNYNLVEEEMIFDQKGTYMTLSEPQNIDTVFLNNRIFVPVEEAFYEVLSHGNITFFMQHKARYSTVGTPTAYGMTSQTNSSVRVTSVRSATQFRTIDVPDNVTVTLASQYWVRKKGSMEKFSNQRGFLKIFPEKETELKQFCNSNKIDFKSREDMIKLANYCLALFK